MYNKILLLISSAKRCKINGSEILKNDYLIKTAQNKIMHADYKAKASLNIQNKVVSYFLAVIIIIGRVCFRGRKNIF